MRAILVICFTLLLVAMVCEARGRRGRSNKRLREGHPRRGYRRHRDQWRPRSDWRSLLSSINTRFDNKDYGFDFGLHEDDFKFNVNFGWGREPWWTGPNVCKTKTEEVSNTTESGTLDIARHFSFHSHVCDETESAYKCTTTSRVMDKKRVTIEVYECCKGFARKEDELGCPRERNLKDLVDTAKSLGLTEFLKAADSVFLTEELKEGNFTVFAPRDTSFSKLDNSLPELGAILPQDMGNKVVMVSKPVTDLVVKNLRNLLLGHLAVGQYRTSSLHDEQLIETGSPYKAKIRINFYDTPQKMTTANCVKIVSSDNVATNGVIHTVESLLEPVTGTIVDVVSKSPQLGYLKTALARAEMVQTYREDGQFTLFAPTDAAFKKMDKGVLQKLLKGDRKCLKKVLDNHVLPNVICSSIITGRAKSLNQLGKYVNLTRDEDSKLFVNAAQVVETDIMTSNGVIHIIDEVLVPGEALQLTEQMEKQGTTKFLGLLKQAKLITDIQKASNITLFVPSNEALESLPDEVFKRFESDPDYLREVLQYHVIPEEIDSRNLYNNYHLDTMNGQKKIRINEYSLFPYNSHWTQTAQCAPVKTRNIPSCNGQINILDKVMIPPRGNVLDILTLDKRLSELVKLFKEAELADALQQEGPLTVFAPTNEAFKAFGARTLKMIVGDKEQLRKVLKNHIAKDALCCAGIFKGGWYGSPRLRTVGGQNFNLHRSDDDQIKIGPARVAQCDISGTNGVVHLIDRVLFEGLPDDVLGHLLRGWRRRLRFRNPWKWS